MSCTTRYISAPAVFLLLFAVPVFSAPGDSVTEAPTGIVDCLLPGPLRRIGGSLYQLPQRPARLTASECTIRGGDFLLYDRANYETSLKYWVTQAEQGAGDPDAMLYVAEIHEQGIGRAPDYVAAARWYQKAADNGNTTAMISLAHLYKTGKGVELDLEAAQRLYSEAFGTDIPIPLDPTSVKGADQRVETLVSEVDEVRRQKIAVELELQAANEQLTNARRNLDDAVAGDGENAELIKQMQVSIEQQRSEISSYQDNLDRMRAENSELTTLRQQLEDKELEAARLKEMLLSAESSVDSSKTQLEQQQELLSAQQVEFNELLADVNADRNTLRASSSQLDAQRENIHAMEEALRKSEEERDLYQALASDAATQQDRVATLTARITVLQQQSNDAEAESEAMRQELDRARGQLDVQIAASSSTEQASVSELASRETEIERLRAAVSRAETEAQRHNSDIDRLTQQSIALEQLRADLEREQAQSNRLQQLLSESQDKYSASNNRIEELNSSQVALEKEIVALRTNASVDDQATQSLLDERQKELESQRAETRVLEEQIAGSEVDFQRYQQQMSDTATRQTQAIEGLRAAVAQSHSERAQLEGKLASASEQLDNALTDLQLEQQRHAALQDELREARAQDTGNDDALNVMQSRLDGQNQQVSLLQQERDRLNEQAERYLAQINDLQERAQASKIEFVGPKLEMLEPNDNILVNSDPATRGEEGLSEVTIITANHIGETKNIRGRVAAPGGLAQLTIGGYPVSFDDNYSFTMTKTIEKESEHVRIVATDHSGKQDIKEFRYEIVGADSQAAIVRNKTERFEDTRDKALDHLKYYALIIANEEYAHPDIDDLDTPITDAIAIGAVLEQRYGFQVEILRNATQRQIRTEIERILIVEESDDDRDNDKDAVLVYYAGHGIQGDSRTDNAYFWIPSDAEYNLTSTWVRTETVEDYMRESAIKQLMVVADSCFAGEILSRDGMAADHVSELARAWKNYVKAYTEEKNSRFVLTSGGNAPVLDGGGDGHSVFARAFLKVLEDNNEILSASRLHEKVAPQVLDLASKQSFKQTPFFGYLRSAKHQFGNFYLPAPRYEAEQVATIGERSSIPGGKVAARSDQ